VDVRPLALLFLALPAGEGELPLSPDLESAATAAVGELRALLFAVPEAGREAWRIRRSGGEDAAAAEATRAVIAALAAAGVSAKEDRKGGGGVALEVDHLFLDGREAILLRGESPPTGSVLAPFVRKPWVRGPPLPAEAGGLVARAQSEFETTSSAAVAQATAAAAADLRRQLARCGISETALPRLLPDGEAGRRFLADLFVRREGRGDLWRADALLRMRAGEIPPLVAEAARIDRRARAGRGAALVALAGISLASFFVYLWLDFATAGRFTNLLRLLVIGLVAAGAGVLL
jgi:hypothetical protein